MSSNIITVSGYTAPVRLDRFLREYFNGITQGFIEQALRKQQITVNGLKANAGLRVQDSDIITTAASFKFIATNEMVKTPSAAAKQLAIDLLNKYKIFADDNILIINKPAGLAVQGGSKINLCIHDALDYLNKQNSSQDIVDYKITHRLDKDTSGLLLIAKNRLAATIIADAFKERLIKKIYLAVLSKIPAQQSGVIKSYISKSSSKHYQRVAEDNINGKLAITEYKIIKVIAHQQALVEFSPLTGRMHQLRVHSQAIGCPIVGDYKYGFSDDEAFDDSIPGNDDINGSSKLLLHAHQLSLPENLFNKAYNFTVNTPTYWPKLI